MSRDPEDGDSSNPAALHKYIYAGGDPVNLADPTGRASQTGTQTAGGGAEIEYGDFVVLALKSASALVATATAIDCVDQFLGTRTLSEVLFGIDSGAGNNPLIQRTGLCTVKEKKRKCTDEHPTWPVQHVSFSTTPVIAAHIAFALRFGWPDGRWPGHPFEW
jgi:hypothetical protein